MLEGEMQLLLEDRNYNRKMLWTILGITVTSWGSVLYLVNSHIANTAIHRIAAFLSNVVAQAAGMPR